MLSHFVLFLVNYLNTDLHHVDFIFQISQLPFILLLLCFQLDFSFCALLFKLLDLFGIFFDGLLFYGQELAKCHLVLSKFF